MTDKQIIIDDQKETIHRLQQECTEKTDTIIALGEQLQAKEQECEKLKKQLMQKSEVDMFFNTPIEGWSSDPCGVCKYKNCLTEIKDMCSEINCESLMQNSWCGNTDFKMGCCEKLFKKQILQKINECEVENDRKENCN